MTNTGFNLNRPKLALYQLEKMLSEDNPRQVEDQLGLLLNGESGYTGLFSTLNDLTVFVEMMLNRGNIKEKKSLITAI